MSSEDTFARDIEMGPAISLNDPATVPTSRQRLRENPFLQAFSVKPCVRRCLQIFLHRRGVPGPTNLKQVDLSIKCRKLESCPSGFPRFAAFQDSDENFMLYRRFGFLHSRILLYKQDELGHLEKKLDDLDHQDLLLDKRCLKDRIRDDAREPQTRKQLLDLIEERLLKYDEILLKSKEVAALNRPSKRDYESVKSYLQIEKPFFKSGLQFIRCKEDFITLRPGRGSAWVDGFFEDILRHIHWRPLTNLFSNEEHRAKSDNLDLHYHSKKRFSVFIGLTLGILILLLLVLPVYILYQLSTEANRTFVSVGLMLVFTLLFSIVLSVFTKAKRQEILAASAAYCAVMVVFIGNLKGPQ